MYGFKANNTSPTYGDYFAKHGNVMWRQNEIRI